jgi:hypothetical protein
MKALREGKGDGGSGSAGLFPLAERKKAAPFLIGGLIGFDVNRRIQRLTLTSMLVTTGSESCPCEPAEHLRPY